MFPIKILYSAIFLLALSACATTTSKDNPTSIDKIGFRNIENVNVSYKENSESPIEIFDEDNEKDPKEFLNQFRAIVKNKLEDRDSDNELKTDIEIVIDQIIYGNALKAVLIGTADIIGGTVKLYNSDDKTFIDEFPILYRRSLDGALGLAVRGNRTDQLLAVGFANRIADKLEFPKPEKEPTPFR